MTTKIATCSYCGTRTALKLTARHGHELACGRCGAPLHEMKALKESAAPAPKRARPAPDPRVRYESEAPYSSKKKRKKRKKPMWSRMLEEAFDVVEDIFD
ncbi:hypothetical protein [Nioella nitratireducens]|uniref:hypothetical protein n=1 Tax=Nioella nitratireducens TaxID=1287720 RepID=UPI0008FD5188|nr:hypothetical protein [Nioella nitratireducens]